MSIIKTVAASPKLKVGDIKYNSEEIIKTAREATGMDADIILFPELALTACSCADLFTQKLLREASLKALKDLSDRLPHNILTVIGAPITADGKLYNCAVSFLDGNIIMATPKRILSTSSERDERRWFEPADDTIAEFDICGLKVPVGYSCMLSGDDEETMIDICIGEECFADGYCADCCCADESCCADGCCSDEDCGEDCADDCCDGKGGIILNPAASMEIIGRNAERKARLRSFSKKHGCAYVYASAGACESTAAGVYSGDCTVAVCGEILATSDLLSLEGSLAFCGIDPNKLKTSEENAAEEKTGTDETADLHSGSYTNPHPFIPDESEAEERCRLVRDIQTVALARRLKHIGCKDVVIGISGGLDSTLALLSTCNAFDLAGLPRTGIHAVTMPGLGTTETTKSIADDLMEALKVSRKTINISASIKQHFLDIDHDIEDYSVAYENAQARERTQILMDIANDVNGLVIGTGDLSEIAIGWCTYNGDQMSMYGLNCGIPKTFIPALINSYRKVFGDEVGDIAKRVTDIPISPELLPADASGDIAQKTEDLIGPYELHDFFLYHMVRYGETPREIYEAALNAFEGIHDSGTIKKWLPIFMRRFFSAQFKRTASPEGPKVGSVSLSAHGDWNMPADASCALWLEQAEKL
jgi:NAD+ synthase (glutamine-hydrolysing)